MIGPLDGRFKKQLPPRSRPIPRSQDNNRKVGYHSPTFQGFGARDGPCLRNIPSTRSGPSEKERARPSVSRLCYPIHHRTHDTTPHPARTPSDTSRLGGRMTNGESRALDTGITCLYAGGDDPTAEYAILEALFCAFVPRKHLLIGVPIQVSSSFTVLAAIRKRPGQRSNANRKLRASAVPHSASA